MKFHRITISVLVPVNESSTVEEAAEGFCSDVSEVLGQGSTAGLVMNPRVESFDPDPQPECGICGAFGIPNEDGTYQLVRREREMGLRCRTCNEEVRSPVTPSPPVVDERTMEEVEAELAETKRQVRIYLDGITNRTVC